MIKKYFQILFTMLIVVFVSHSTSAQMGSYNRQQILFLKWGSGDNEIGLKTVKPRGYKLNNGVEYLTPFIFGIDSKENVYILDLFNGRVLVYSVKGEFLKQIETDQNTPNLLVGDDGDVY